MTAALTPREGVTPTMNHILLVLANYANEDMQCWVSVRRLRAVTNLSERGVQVQIGALERVGLLKREARQRPGGSATTNLITLTFSAFDQGANPPAPDAGAPAPRAPPPPHQVRGDPAPRAPLTSFDPLPEPLGADAPKTCAREPISIDGSVGAAEPLAPDAVVAFEALFVAWRDKRPGRLSRPKSLAAWRIAAAKVDPARIVAAGVRYLAEDEQVRRLGPQDLHRWLEEDRWEPWLAAPRRPDRVGGLWRGPAEVRAAVVAAEGETFAAAYLDRSSWDADRAAILTATGVAAERLKDLARTLGKVGVNIIEKREAA